MSERLTPAPHAIGAAAVSMEAYDHATAQITEGMEVYFDDEVSMPLDEQLAFTQTVWGLCGFKVPTPKAEQAARLEQATTEHPGYRLMPAPILNVDTRAVLMSNAQALPLSAAARPHITSSLNLRTDIARAYESPDYRYSRPDYGHEGGVVYKIEESDGADPSRPHQHLVPREAYLGGLVSKGMVVKARKPDTTLWAFPLMETAVEVPEITCSAKEALQTISPVAIPEAIFMLRLLHHMADVPRTGKVCAELTNESAYIQREDPRVATPPELIVFDTMAVTWGGDYSRVKMAMKGDMLQEKRYPRSLDDDVTIGTRQIVNGLEM